MLAKVLSAVAPGVEAIALLCLFIVSGLQAAAAEKPETWPLWDGQESVAEYAKRVNLPPTQTLDLGNGVKMELVLIPAGKFLMGSPEHEKPAVGQAMAGISGGVLFVALVVLLIRAVKKRKRPQISLLFLMAMMFVASFGVWGGVRWHEALKHVYEYEDEHPAHEVTLTKPFYMGKYEVTQEQYQQEMGANPSGFKGKDNPMEMVSWYEAQEFCKKLAEQTKQTIRLPREAEWEYSCRAGTRTAYYSGDTDEDLDRVAWYFANSKNTTHPVGQKEPNLFGLYDMHGNVREWCKDWYGGDYYSKSLTENPEGPAQGAYRVLRGSWHYSPMFCRTAFRRWTIPGRRLNFIGFRVVLPAFRTP